MIEMEVIEMSEVTPVLNQIVGALSALSAQVRGLLPDDLSLAEQINWQQPAATKQDILDRIQRTADNVNSIISVDVKDQAIISRLNKIPATVNYVASSMPNMLGGNAFYGYISLSALLDSIDSLVLMISPPSPDWVEIADKNLVPASIKKRLDNFSKSVSNIEKQFGAIEDKIKSIDEAYQAATALPATLAGLEDARGKFEEGSREIERIVGRIKDDDKDIKGYKEEIERNLFKSHEITGEIYEVHSAATRQGLGKSFQDRADSLKNSTYVLMCLLAVCLGIAACISHSRISFIEDMLSKPGLDSQVLWANLLLTGFGVAAPIWFAWLLTRQISQRFRLAEDYGFKASVAKAYEGYRRESKEIGDSELQLRLLSIALDRVEESPLSHIERDESSTPLHDLLKGLTNRSSKSESSAKDPKGE